MQIDCFESFTAKRNSLTWRVLNKCGGYWAAEQQDFGLRERPQTLQKGTKRIKKTIV